MLLIISLIFDMFSFVFAQELLGRWCYVEERIAYVM